MRVTGYAYPWDVLGDPGFADRTAELGVHEVAVATAYHAVRAATPWQAGRVEVQAARAALYRPVRPSAWAGRELSPVPGEFDTAHAVAALRKAGLPVALWLVLNHNTALGTRVPRVSTQDCFGTRHPWALCVGRPEVREYAATLAAEAVRGLAPDSVVLEACGQFGAVHQHLHEKTDGVWSPAVTRLLSICCCPACGATWAGAGLDPERVRTALRERVRALIATGDLDRVEDGLTGELGAVLAARQRATDELRAAVLARVRPARVLLHASPDPWATGALPGLTPATSAGSGDVDGVVVPCWRPGPDSLHDVRRARETLPAEVTVGGYVTAVAAAPVPDIGGYVRDLAAAGATELHLYHLGLAGPARLGHLRDAIHAARERELAP